MRRGNSYDLRFKLVPNDDYGDPGLLKETSRALHERTLTATFEVVFIGQKPKVLWNYERLTFFECPGVPKVSNVLELGEGSSVRVGFQDLYGGLFNGIAWEW